MNPIKACYPIGFIKAFMTKTFLPFQLYGFI